MADTKVNLNLLNDQAIGESDLDLQDGLGFETYAKVLAGAARGTHGPFTIGVFGEWGTGKTSLLRMIQADLVDDPGIVTVWFNAWRYEKEEHPIVPLVATIIREIQSKKNFTENLKDQGAALIRALRAVAYGFSAKSKVKVPGFAEIEAGFVAKDMIDREKELTPDPLLDRSLYYEAFETLSNIDLGSEVKVVVIIDDLDRCFPDLAIQLLESIKLVLCQPNFIFILGVARSVIEGYLCHRYQTEYGIQDFEGQKYLDKIVQLPFYIPRHTERMESFSEKLLVRVDDTAREEISEILPIIGLISGSNPRSTVRFVNNLLIDRAVNKLLAEAGSIEIIPISYFAITRCLEQRWHGIYATLLANEEICKIISDIDSANLGALDETESKLIGGIADLIDADDDLAGLIFSKQGRRWLSQPELRRAATVFLRTQRKEEEKIDTDPQPVEITISCHISDFSIVGEIADVLRMYNMIVRILSPKNEDWFWDTHYYEKSKLNVIVYVSNENLYNEDEEFIKHVLDHGGKVILLLGYDVKMESIPAEYHKLWHVKMLSDKINTESMEHLVKTLMSVRTLP